MINTIIFDIGNVLVPFNWQEVYADLFDEETAAIVAAATVEQVELWNEFDKGSKSDAEIMEGFYAAAPLYREEIKKGVWEIYNRMKPFAYSYEWLKALKYRGYKVYLLSNFGKTSFETAKKEFSFMEYCDGGVISYEVEKIKPDPMIFGILCQKFRISPCEAVFIDDNRANIEGARDFGFSTILFTDKVSADSQLKDLGVTY